METNLITNGLGKARRVTRNGKEYLVAPATIFSPGILHGSQGPLLYRPGMLARKAGTWNNIPLVVDHPTLNGENVSVKDLGEDHPSIIGFTRNDVWDGKRHRAETWFDVQRTREYDKVLTKNGRPALLPRLERGQPTDLSTGIFTKVRNAKPGEHWEGTPYSHDVMDYTNDHLAILPDVPGACAIRDGCGVFNAKYTFKGENCPECGVSMEGDPDSGTCNSCGHAWGQKVAETNNAKRCSECNAMLNSKGECPECAADEAESSEHDYTYNELSQPRHPKDGKWQGKASKAAEKGFMDLAADTEPEAIDDEDQEVGQGDRPSTVKPTTPQGVQPVPMTANQRGEVITFLTTNCDCWKGKDDAATLNKFSDDKLLNLKNQTLAAKREKVVSNLLHQSIKLNEGETLAVNQEGKLVTNAGRAVRVMANFDDGEAAGAEVEGEEDPMAEEDPNADPAAPPAAAGAKKPPAPASAQPPPKKGPPPVGNTRFKTIKEFEEVMPPEALEVWNASKEIVAQERQQLIGKLTANVRDDATKQQLTKMYGKLSTNDLKLALAAAPQPAPQPQNGHVNRLPPSYINAFPGGGGVTTNQGEDDGDTLDILTMNELAAEEREIMDRAKNRR